MTKTVLITGGSRGIGAACVQRFAEDGWRTVFTWNRGQEAAEALCASLRSRGLDVSCLQCDIASAASIREAVQQVLRTHHRVDALVNNAGIAHIGLFTDMTDEQLDRIIRTDLTGAMLMSRAVLPGMISEKSGCIVNISSMWGEVGASCEVAYSACKAGIIGLTRALAKEVGPSGIRVNCVSPGVIDTDMNHELTAEDLAALADETPLGRIGQPAEIADAVLWLCGSQSAFITGQVLGVSGGLII